MKKHTILLLVLVSLLIAALIYFIYNVRSKYNKQAANQENPVSTTSYEYVNTTQGYSLYVPNNFKILSTTTNETEFIHTSNNLDNGLVWIDTEPANGRTLEQVVKAVIEDQGGVLNIKTSAINIDGEQAVVIEPLSGQNLIRQIDVIHNDILYRMNFAPDASQLGEPYENMDSFYKSVKDTFRFKK